MWEIRNFLESFDAWVEQDDPPAEWRVVVMSWVHALQTDPYRGATRVLDLGADWWFARIPGATDDHRTAVCLYKIDSEANSVTCSSITVLSEPITE